jgi:predicted nucleic acid-binding protein
MKIALDSNVISELLKPAPAVELQRWARTISSGSTYLTATVAAELLRGLQLMPDGRRREQLAAAIDGVLDEHRERTFPFDLAAARAFAVIVAARRGQGRPISFADAQIAAICAVHDATLATRNVRDFEGCGIHLVNPWEH